MSTTLRVSALPREDESEWFNLTKHVMADRRASARVSATHRLLSYRRWMAGTPAKSLQTVSPRRLSGDLPAGRPGRSLDFLTLCHPTNPAAHPQDRPR